jgi:hypothetical protein
VVMGQHPSKRVWWGAEEGGWVVEGGHAVGGGGGSRRDGSGWEWPVAARGSWVGAGSIQSHEIGEARSPTVGPSHSDGRWGSNALNRFRIQIVQKQSNISKL